MGQRLRIAPHILTREVRTEHVQYLQVGFHPFPCFHSLLFCRQFPSLTPSPAHAAIAALQPDLKTKDPLSIGIPSTQMPSGPAGGRRDVHVLGGRGGVDRDKGLARRGLGNSDVTYWVGKGGAAPGMVGL